MANEPCYGGLKYVAAPAVEQRPFGLFSTAVILDFADPHEQMGVQWEPNRCDAADHAPTCTCFADGSGEGISTLGGEKPVDAGVGLTVATPFTVYGSFACSPFGHWDDAYARAQAHLLAGEERAVETAIATGVGHTSNAFASANTVDVTPTPGTAVPLAEGLALLEQYLAENYPGVGTIHAAPVLASHLNSQGLIFTQTNTGLFTALGTRIAAGGGYTGLVGPGESEAPEDGSYWLYATGRVIIRRSEAFMTPPDKQNALNTSTNDLEVRAERTYVVGWDCITAAVLVSPSSSDDVLGTVDVGNFPASYPQPTTQRTTGLVRVNTATTTAITAGSRSYSVTVVAAASSASPTLEGVAIPMGMTVRYEAPENDTLEAASVVTVSGDDVIITEVR